MQIVFEVPEDIAGFLAGPDISGTPRSLNRQALEALGAEGCRSGILPETQLMRLLGLPSRFAVHDWLRNRGIPYRYTAGDLAADLDNLSALGLR